MSRKRAIAVAIVAIALLAFWYRSSQARKFDITGGNDALL